jgi:methionine synthase II (cobalamin-independent)
VWTLAATLAHPRGAAVLSDRGACRDLAESLAEGVAAHVAEVRRRVPGARVVLQLDEPALPAVLAGSVPTVSGFGAWAPVELAVATPALAQVITAVDVPVVIHCCASRAPLDMLREAGAAGLSFDTELLDQAADEPLGRAVEAGLTLLAGVPAAGGAARIRELWRRIGFPAEQLAAAVVVTPSCGLAGATWAAAQAATRTCRAVARELLDDPEG